MYTNRSQKLHTQRDTCKLHLRIHNAHRYLQICIKAYVRTHTHTHTYTFTRRAALLKRKSKYTLLRHNKRKYGKKWIAGAGRNKWAVTHNKTGTIVPWNGFSSLTCRRLVVSSILFWVPRSYQLVLITAFLYRCC